MRLAAGSLNLYSAVESLESNLIEQALDSAKGNKTLAARILGVNRTTLHMKMLKLGITHPLTNQVSNTQHDKAE